MVNTKFHSILKKIQKFRDDRDWAQFHNAKDMAAGIAIEAAELQELFLWKNRQEVEVYIKDKKNVEKISYELADIFSYAFELAENLGIDIEKSIEKKMRKNALHYPVQKAKGKHTKHTKL